MANRHPTPRPRNRRIVPALIAAALAVVWGLAPSGASASSASIVAGHRPAIEATEHGHHCKCLMHCKSACCCVVNDEPRKQAAPAPASVHPTPTLPAVPAGPCLKAAPCGGATIPAAPVVRIGSPAAASVAAAIRPSTAGVPVALLPFALPPSAALARIDEPPESRVRA